MKMEWKKPELEVLDVNQTMLGKNGAFLDASHDPLTPVEEITTS